MSLDKQGWSRRSFLKVAGMTGVGFTVTSANDLLAVSSEQKTIPKRFFGKTGINVPILSFGGSLDTSMSTLVLKQAFKYGVTYWDTAHTYMGGRSEKGIGKYLEKYPADRKEIFLVTKTKAWTIKGMSKDLDQSLERMKTDYIDLYFVHSVKRTGELGKNTRAWAERMKSRGKIRLFGFSTHSNMETCMAAASKLGWIDGIMMSYNYRLMHTDTMKRTVDACVEAGIGLTAMKTQGGGQIKTSTETEMQLAGRFLEKGFTDAQARLKAVWENSNIASICSEMPNITLLLSNVAAALDRTTLSAAEIEMLRRYAEETRSDYCAGCADICESAVEGDIPICEVMRCLMYARGYGSLRRASTLFQEIPPDIRNKIAFCDYSSAEQKCPQNMAVGRLMREAVVELS